MPHLFDNAPESREGRTSFKGLGLYLRLSWLSAFLPERVAPSAPCPQGADSPAPPGLGAGSGHGAWLLLPGVLGSSAIWWGSRTWLKAAWVSTGTYQIPLQANSHHEPGRRQTQPAKMWRVCCRVSWWDMMNRRAGMMGMCWERGWGAEGMRRRR